MKHHKPYLFRILISRPRLSLSVLLALSIYFLIPEVQIPREITRIIIAWNSGVLLYLALAARMMFFSNHQKIQDRARKEDDGRFLILILVILAVIFSLISIVLELAIVRNLQGYDRYMHMALAGSSIATSWFFTHVIFALHYAHDYYLEVLKGRPGGLVFPGETNPDYGDFLYLSFIIGTSAQTADVSYASRRMRRTGLAHCVLSFFFNTTLLALTINIASSLF